MPKCKMQKIAYIGLRGVPACYSGVEKSVEEIGSRLASRGHSVTVYCMATEYAERPASYKGMRLIYIPTLRGKNSEMVIYSVLASIAALWNGEQIFHYHALGPSTCAILPRLLGRSVICTVHGLDWKRNKWGFVARTYLRLGEFIAAHFSNRLVFVSNSLSEYFKNRYHVIGKVIPNGIEDGVFVPLSSGLKRLGLAENGYVLFVGRLTQEKFVHGLIGAYRSVSSAKKLLIVGGNQHDTGYVDYLKEIAAGDDRIVFLGEIYNRTVVQSLYSHAHLFVLPSLIEGMPLVLLEALSFDCPVLVSDIAENIEVLTEQDGRQCGFTFQCGSGQSLRDTLEHLLNELDEREIELVRQRSHELLRARYDWDHVANQIEKVLEGLL